MDVLVSLIISLLLLLLVAGARGSSATSKTAAEYWRTVLPETATPQAILDQLTPHAAVDGSPDDMSISSNNLKFVEGLRKIGPKYFHEASHAQVGLKEVSVSYGDQGEEYVNKGTLVHNPKSHKDMRITSMPVGSQANQELEKIFASHKPEVGEKLKEVSISYGLQGEKDTKKVPLNLKKIFATYKPNREVNLKEVSVSYGSVGGEDLKEVSVLYGLEGKQDLKEVSVSYGVEGGEDNLKEVSTPYGAEHGDNLKEVSVSYETGQEKNLKEVSLSYSVEGADNLREVSVSYGTSQKKYLKEGSVSYGTEQEGSLKEVSVSYGSDESKYGHNEVSNQVEEDDPNRQTMSYGSEHEDDPHEVTMSHGSRRVEDSKTRTDVTGEGSHHHHVEAHAHSHNNKRQQAGVFFFHDMLRPGSIITPTIPPTTSLPAFLPRDVANSIPFSTKRLSEIISTFAPASRAMSRDMRWTLDTCEHPRTLPDQKAGCATSLESLAELPGLLLGTQNVHAFSAANLPIEAPGTAALRRRYNVTAARRISGDSEEVVTCHDLTYPYAVFYCHTANPTAAYAVTLVSVEDGVAPARMEVLAVCHLDTSRWSPKNPFFELHSLKPGDVSVCHFLTKLSIIWVRGGELAQRDGHPMAM